MKKLAIVAGCLAGLLILVVLLAPLLINGERFRPMLEQQASEALGRATRIGTLNVSLLSGGVSAEQLSIADDAAFSAQPFVTASKLSIGAKLLPLLLERKLIITNVTLERPEIHLIQNKAGVWNYASIGAKTKKDAAKEPAGTSSAMSVAVDRVRISDGRITVVNEADAAHPLTLDKLAITAGPLAAGVAVPVQLKVALGGGTVDLQGNVGPLAEGDSTRTPFQLSAIVADLDLAKSGLLGADSAIAGVAAFDGTLRSDGTRVQLKGKTQLAKAHFSAGAPLAPKPLTVQSDIAYTLVTHVGDLRGVTMHAGAAQAQISGKVNLMPATPVVDVQLHGRQMPVNELVAFLPSFGVTLPSGASLKGGTLNVELNASGSVARPTGHATVRLENTQLTGYDLATEMKTLSALAGVQPHQDTAIALLSTTADVVATGLNVTDAKLNVPALGELIGTGTLSRDDQLNFEMVANINPNAGLIGGTAHAVGGAVGQKGIPFRVTGPMAKPRFTPEVGKYLKQQFTSSEQTKQLNDTVNQFKSLFRKPK